jgi:hypothetical protein
VGAQAIDLIDEAGSRVRLRHIQLPEEARDLDKELRQVRRSGGRVGCSLQGGPRTTSCGIAAEMLWRSQPKSAERAQVLP